MITKEEILEFEQVCWKDELEHWSPHVVLDLIDEIKRLNGWEILPRPWDSKAPIRPVEFDFSEVE